MKKMARSVQDIITIKDLNPDAWQRIFRSFLGEEVDLVNPDEVVDFKSFGGTNDYYNSVIVKNEIVVQKKDGSQVTFPVVIKNPVQSRMHRLMSKYMRTFQTEIFFYNTVAREFSEVRDLFPTCYHGRSNYSDEVFDKPCCEQNCCCLCWCPCAKSEKGILILHDLTHPEPGSDLPPFKVLEKTEVPSLDHIKLVLRSLARYHGTWFKFLHTDEFKEYDGRYCKYRMQISFDFRRSISFTPQQIKKFLIKDDILLVLSLMVKSQMKTLKSMMELMKNRKESPELIAKFERFSKTRFKPLIKASLQKSLGTQSDLKLYTVIHGDFWGNNMMFSESDQGQPLAVKFLDFQMSGCGHPAFDILYFTYICLDHQTRLEHEQEYLRAYFDELSKYVNPTLNMTFDDFMKEMNDLRMLSTWGGIGVMANVLSPNQVELKGVTAFRDMDRKRHQEIATPDRPDDHPHVRLIRDRLIGFVHEFDARGLLDQ